ncbi:MAG: hypothetical protein AAGB31_02065 [Bdellovibrio sp.]
MASSNCLDTSFIHLTMAHLQHPSPETEQALLQSSALQVIVRHRHSSGSSEATPENTLKMLKLSQFDPTILKQQLQKVEGKSHFCELAKESAATLPTDFQFRGKVYFVLGYDIGIASPPDILINLAHEKFLNHSSEIEPYIIHETHHIGFFQHQPIPSLEKLEDPQHLLALIKWGTHSEGMAVHAAYHYRRTHGLLLQDRDYQVYTDSEERLRIIEAYKSLIQLIRSSQQPLDINDILGKMSSEERLWYRFGAIVAHSLQQKGKEDLLIQTLSQPQIFWNEAESIMAASSEL